MDSAEPKPQRVTERSLRRFEVRYACRLEARLGPRSAFWSSPTLDPAPCKGRGGGERPLQRRTLTGRFSGRRVNVCVRPDRGRQAKGSRPRPQIGVGSSYFPGGQLFVSPARFRWPWSTCKSECQHKSNVEVACCRPQRIHVDRVPGRHEPTPRVGTRRESRRTSTPRLSSRTLEAIRQLAMEFSLEGWRAGFVLDTQYRVPV